MKLVPISVKFARQQSLRLQGGQSRRNQQGNLQLQVLDSVYHFCWDLVGFILALGTPGPNFRGVSSVNQLG